MLPLRATWHYLIESPELLYSLTGVDFCGVEITLGVGCDIVDCVKLSCPATRSSDASFNRMGSAIDDPYLIVYAVDHINVSLIVVMRECDV